MLAALVILAALNATPPEPAQWVPTPKVWQVEFAPLSKRERSYARLGPAGPFYPDKAARRRVSGYVLLDCRVLPRGELAGCRMIWEDPTGYSFGAAALRLAELKRIRLIETEPEGKQVRVRVPFQPAS